MAEGRRPSGVLASEAVSEGYKDTMMVRLFIT